MKTIHRVVFFTMTILCFEASAQDSFQNVWNAKMNFFDKKYAEVTTLHVSDDGKNITVLNPLGLEVFQVSGGQRLAESPCVQNGSNKAKRTSGSSGSKGITVGGGKKEKLTLAEEMDALSKIVHIPIPGKNAVLRFNYGISGLGGSKESISRIDIETGEVIWTNNELSWSMENAKFLMKFLASKSRDKNTAAILGADWLHYPAFYINSLTKVLPDRDELWVDSFLGLACVDLSTGKVKWVALETALGLSHILYDQESNSILAFGGNPAWLPKLPILSNMFQLSKGIFRINADTGEIIWKSGYNKNYREKREGGFRNQPLQPDIRLSNNRIIINFNQIEVFDFETGNPLIETSTGKDASMSLLGYGPASEFAFPLIDGDMLYRSVITSVMAFGAAVAGKEPNNFRAVLEAYNMATGELLWTTKEFSRQKINNMTIRNGLLLLSFDGNEGVKALNPKTGETLWAFETSKKGIATKWLLVDNKLIVAENKNIHVLDQKSGKVLHTLNAGKSAGKFSQLKLYKNNLLVVGKKKGMEWYDLKTGTLITAVKTGYAAELLEYTDKVLVFPKNPSGRMLILDPNNLNVLGEVKKSGKRTALSWCETNSNVYTVQKKKVEARHFSGLRN
ncbi:MAG: PQQ-binding-like beta-propeller repeat protein [Bacteroidetes bacterium]|nr:PQQ-binding-like beta-propeller repeat protein [Bacteroidota bacterium]